MGAMFVLHYEEEGSQHSAEDEQDLQEGQQTALNTW